MRIRTLIVDDMPLARRRLRECLTEDPEIEVVGECANGREAIAAITAHVPDLVFLDVQMPQVGGFDVIEAVGADVMPAVIFVTAYDEFAIRAFDVNALDYLMKPFEEARLTTAVLRAKRQIARRGAGDLDSRLRHLLDQIKGETRYPKRLTIKSGRHAFLLPVEDIDWVGGAGNYVEIHVGRQTHLLRERLNELEKKLPPGTFVRIHRSTIVNVDRIRQYQPTFNGDQIIHLLDGTRLTASRTYVSNLKAALDAS